jgi:oxepin-CoA hydrolase/3-oxo-5,6-dehydrosuberyl-CoA semialdehyde dehydrogenase
MAEFNEAFKKEPEKQTAHPAFGMLTRDEWMLLQYKHLQHHARQFGLLGSSGN